MGEWREYSILDFAEIHNQSRVPLNKMQRAKKQGMYPYYGASGIIDYVDDYLFDGEFVLISEDGENLKSRQTPIAFKANGQFWVNNHAHILKGRKPFHNNLIIYYFQNMDLNPYITGAVQPKLNKANLLSVPIYLPEDEAEQIAIASVLSSLDDKIDLLHRQNKTLEVMAETLFRQWFVEEAQEDWETTIGELPIDVIDGDRGNNYPKNKELFNTGDCLFLSAKNVTTNGFNFNQCQFITSEKDSLLRSGKLKRNDIVITTRGTVGNIAYYDDLISFSDIRINSGMIILRTEPSVLAPIFVFCLISSNYFKCLIKNQTSGTAQPQLPIRDFKQIEVLFPPKEKIDNLLTFAKPCLNKKFNNDSQIRTLEKLRDTLLPKLMSGEAQVKLN